VAVETTEKNFVIATQYMNAVQINSKQIYVFGGNEDTSMTSFLLELGDLEGNKLVVKSNGVIKLNEGHR